MIPKHFRKMSIRDRQKTIEEIFSFTLEERNLFEGKSDLSDLADVLVESAIGIYPIPLGLACEFMINGKKTAVPMATEEPSVIAAASFAAGIVKAGGGFQAWSDEPIMSGQVFLLDCADHGIEKIKNSEQEIGKAVDDLIPNMVKRGGGFYGLDVKSISEPNALCVTIHIDVREAMGANAINTVVEGIKEKLAGISGGTPLLAIVTNSASMRKAGASFSIPCKLLRKGNLSGEEICERIISATKIANADSDRAVTHNKGIMNGISALALATGNDTRAIEAGAYHWSCRDGKMASLTSYSMEDGMLRGSIELPLPFATEGGSVKSWPASVLSLKLLGNPNTRELSQVAAALGLAQNLAALIALVSEGIQAGHMRLHAARVAYAAGARGEEIRPLAETLWQRNALDLQKAKEIFDEQKRNRKSTS